MIQSVITAVLFAMSAVSAGRTTRLLGAGTANLSRLTLATVFLALWAHGRGQGLGGAGLLWLLASETDIAAPKPTLDSVCPIGRST